MSEISDIKPNARQAEFETFERYVKDRWGWNRSYAYELIDAAGVVEDVRHVGQIPGNARQAAEIGKLKDPEERRC